MNRFQKAGLAIIFASSMIFAAGSPWWTPSAPHGQVAFPWVVDCKDDDSVFDEQNPNNDCFKKMGGWWFGYIAGPVIGGNANGCRVDMAGKTPGQSTAENYVKAKINGETKSFVGPDYPDCQGPDVTNRADGTSYLNGVLEVELAVGTGINGPEKWEPSIAALATNFSTPAGGDKGTVPPVFVKRDMTKYGDGFCLKYESDNDITDKFFLILGWDETDAENSPGRNFYDPYYALIPPAATPTTKDFTWSTSCSGTEPRICGDFEQEGWSKANAQEITKAIKEMMSVKISLQSYTPKKVNFKLYAFGPKGTCDGVVPNPNPIIPGKNIQNVNFTLNGRMLSASISKPAVVQIYSLQGAIVKSQTLTPDGKMNLSNLPTGIYMVRSPSLGYTSRIVLK
ncbi:MAG: T9SS type A sorting domain-containing protein [Fibromonadales bacterium]|nr:T9SS type A sorting domain-containing protein [Fibromonadales bacterium]